MSGWLTDKTGQWSDLGPKKVGFEKIEDNIDDREDEGDDVEMVLGEVFSLLTGDIPSTLSENSNY